MTLIKIVLGLGLSLSLTIVIIKDNWSLVDNIAIGKVETRLVLRDRFIITCLLDAIKIEVDAIFMQWKTCFSFS